MTNNNDIKAKLKRLTDTGAPPLTLPELEWWLATYPTFTLPVIIYLRQHGDSIPADRRARLEEHITLNSPSMSPVFDNSADINEPFYPPTPKAATPDTDTTIDTFLDRYGSNDPAETSLLERLIFNPTPEYSQQLEADDTPREAPVAGSQDDLIDRFIASHPDKSDIREQTDRTPATQPPATPQPSPEPKPNMVTDSATESAEPSVALSESLARIYVKQRRYDRALELISQLSLNNPKKSVYFADQLRFLSKLLKNQEYKNNNK